MYGRVDGMPNSPQSMAVCGMLLLSIVYVCPFRAQLHRMKPPKNEGFSSVTKAITLLEHVKQFASRRRGFAPTVEVGDDVPGCSFAVPLQVQIPESAAMPCARA